ncbi:MAG: hypothetical protein ACLRXQ_03625 [Phascolarctobacterium faecium]
MRALRAVYIAAFTLFPFWLITRTEAGGFIYYATLLFFFTRATALIRRMSPNMSENKTNNTVTCDSCGHSARIHPRLADNMYSRWRKYSRF